MLISSIRTAILILSLFFIVVVGGMVFALSLKEHEHLYASYVESDLDALTDNMANELFAVLNGADSAFQTKALLLSLDPYEHVCGALVFDSSWRLLDMYLGQASVDKDGVMKALDSEYYQGLTPGVFLLDNELVSVKRIGDPGLSSGYLVVINDFEGPIEQSTWRLASHIFPTILLLITFLGIAYYLVVNWWLSPLTRLADFAEEVGRTKNYSLQSPSGGQYEVQALTQNIGNMMRVIQQESEVNEEYVTLLEEQKQEMEYLANYDSLTGLANRSCFMHLLQEALAYGASDQGVTVMFIDLDGFKLVNDSMGHEVGDKLLTMVAQRLMEIAPEGSVISRHGGDEFLILIKPSPGRGQLREIANLLLTGLMQKYQIDSWEVRVTGSIGVATGTVAVDDAANLIRHADVAMYTAKSMGKNRFSFFSDDMMSSYQRRVDIANRIQGSLATDEFSVYYQQKVDTDGKPVGVEALVRWYNPTLGWVSPAEFIPIAEQAGRITDISQWVVERVSRDCANFFCDMPESFRVSVNLSAHDLKKYHMIGYIKGALLKHGLDGRLLEFEVTESAYLDNLDVANRFFDEITALGARVALDDFGTGYSSLSYLTKIPIDLIKIDKQFVDNINRSERDDILVITIIEMAQRLGFELCAEGVETEEQRRFLMKHGCSMFQGYLFHKPMPLDDYRTFVERTSA